MALSAEAVARAAEVAARTPRIVGVSGSAVTLDLNLIGGMAAAAGVDRVAGVAGLADLQSPRTTKPPVPILPMPYLASANQSLDIQYPRSQHANNTSLATETEERLSLRLSLRSQSAMLPRPNNYTGHLTTGHLTIQCRSLTS